MKSQPYYFEIKDTLNQFAAAFDDVVIKRYNANRGVNNQLRVRYLYAPKQRVLHNLVNKAEQITLPAISINVSSISRDVDRVFNKNFGTYLKSQSNAQHIKMPVPVNIEVNMSIIARYTADIDQIISNFVPYNNPYVVISWKVPNDLLGPFSDQEIRSHVHWNESLSYEYPKDIGDNSPYELILNTGFKIEGWLFKEVQADSEPIYYIDSNFYTVSSFQLEGLE